MKKEFDTADIISVGCVYMPPENSPYACWKSTNYFEDLADEINMYANSSVFLCGDFNAQTKNLDDMLPEVSGSDGPFNYVASRNLLSDTYIGARKK